MPLYETPGVVVIQIEAGERPARQVRVPVGELTVDASFRDGGLCPDHVERLVELGGAWPPILVMRSSGVVVDGAHRVAAARRSGLARLEVVWFDGSVEEAFVEFVRRNAVHGLSLTLSERKRAAARVLWAHRAWSDRRVADVCGISPKTVGRLRAGLCPTEEDPQLGVTTRVGRDDRARPVQRGSVRARVVEALQAQPTASLRVLAAEVGVSPETVRLVRLNMAAQPEAPLDALPADGAPGWQADSALASADDGDDFLAWFVQTGVTAADVTRVNAVPLSRVYELADEARNRSQFWLRMARALEARAAKTNTR